MELITQNLADQYRPRNFKEFVGQEQALKPVEGWFKTGKLPSTILITGLTGSGKTTLAKLIAHKVNYDKKRKIKYDFNNPPDVKIVNAGADGKVDVSRELINLSKVAPQMSRKRIIVIDECHNLTKQAEEALLVTLEQPSRHTIWILCTTEKEKVNKTVINRAAKLEVLPIESEIIAERLYEICKLEKVKIKDKKKAKKALGKIAEYADGQMRNGISQLQTFLGLVATGEPFDEKTVVKAYSDTEEAQVDEAAANLLFGLVTHDPKLIISTISKFKDKRMLLNKLIYLLDWFIKYNCDVIGWKPPYGDVFVKKLKAAKGDAKKRIKDSEENLIATYVNFSDVAVNIMVQFNSTNIPQEQLMITWLTKAAIDDYNFTVK